MSLRAVPFPEIPVLTVEVARPVFHHQREAIEAHLTVVFAALAVARHLQDATKEATGRP